jgi:hypothetical protein
VGLPGEPGLEFFASPENGGSGHSIEFSVDHKLDGKPNKGTIEIYNAPRILLTTAQQTTAIVRLFAGYEVEKLIFSGNPIPRYGAYSELSGGDRVVRITAQDGRRAYQQARIDQTWSIGTPLSQVVTAIGVAMAIPITPLPAELSTTELSQGITLTGNPREALRDLGRAIGATAFVRDNALYVLPDGDTTSEPATVFSPATGNALKVVPQKDGIIELTGLLEGSLRPGRRFVIRDHPDYSGTYKARDVSFRGSSGFDTPFDVIATGKAVA